MVVDQQRMTALHALVDSGVTVLAFARDCHGPLIGVMIWIGDVSR